MLLVSDLHYDLRKMDWVVSRASDPGAGFDALVIAGDLLDIGSAVPLDAQITVVLSYLERLAGRLPTLVCSGNHDLDSRRPSGEKASSWLQEAAAFGVIVDGASSDVAGWRLTACAWWEGPDTLAELERRIAAASVERPEHWLWAYHGPPEGLLSWTGSRHFGDPELPRLIDTYAPDVVLCGHIHQAPFTTEGDWVQQQGDTWLFNGGYQRGPEPTFIEIDLDGLTASWHSGGGDETVDLRVPRTGTTVGA